MLGIDLFVLLNNYWISSTSMKSKSWGITEVRTLIFARNLCLSFYLYGVFNLEIYWAQDDQNYTSNTIIF